MPRLFYAVDLPNELRDVLAPRALALRDLGRHIRPVGRHSFHLTLLFLGDQPEAAIPDFGETAKSAVGPARSCEIALGPVGFFPRVSFLTLTGELETLAMVSSVLKNGCESYLERPDTRPFKAHVTLARHKKNVSRTEKERITREFAEFEGRSWVANDLVLYESELTPRGAVYTVVERYAFGG